MRAKLFPVISFKSVAALIVLSLALTITSNASATIINFDDLNPVYDPENPCWCDNPLTDQYASKGVLISGAWVNGANSHNVMLTSNSASLDFVNALPTFVSMNITSEHDDAIFLSFYNTSGLLGVIHTAGWMGPDNEYIPTIPNELVSFSSATGISHINIENFYNLRTGASIDNLTFTYSSVPEPTSLVFMGLGLIALAWRRLKITKDF